MKTKKITVLVEGRLSEKEMNSLYAGFILDACRDEYNISPCNPSNLSPHNYSICRLDISSPCDPSVVSPNAYSICAPEHIP